MRCLNAFVAEPECNDRDIDSRLEQVHGGAVPHDMRRDGLGREARAARHRALAGALEKILGAVTRERMAPCIGESHRPAKRLSLLEPALQDPGGVGPERDRTLLTTFAV